MCVYALTIFTCSHGQWGARMRSCIIGREFQAGSLPEDCVFRKPHGFKSIRSSHACNDCMETDVKTQSSERSLADVDMDYETGLDRQIERAAREDRERRFQEEKARLDEIRKVKRRLLACYESGSSKTVDSDAWIYSEDGEIKTSPRREAFDNDNADNTKDDDKSQADSAIELGVTYPEKSSRTDCDGEQTLVAAAHGKEGVLSPRVSMTSIPTTTSQTSEYEESECDIDQKLAHSFEPSSTPQKTKISAIPRSIPKSRLAMPKSTSGPKYIRAVTTPSPPPRMPDNEPSKFSIAKTMTPKSAPKSHLAVPVSKTPPRYAPTTITPPKSQLPKLGSTRK